MSHYHQKPLPNSKLQLLSECWSQTLNFIIKTQACFVLLSTLQEQFCTNSFILNMQTIVFPVNCTGVRENRKGNKKTVWPVFEIFHLTFIYQCCFLNLSPCQKNKTKQQIIKSINTYIKSLFCSLPAISRLFLLCAVLWQHKFWGETQSLKLNQRFCTAH